MHVFRLVHTGKMLISCVVFSLYTFDIRKFKVPIIAHIDHTMAVIDCEYSPTGKEVVSGSYDRTLRIFDVTQVKSRYVLEGFTVAIHIFQF